MKTIKKPEYLVNSRVSASIKPGVFTSQSLAGEADSSGTETAKSTRLRLPSQTKTCSAEFTCSVPEASLIVTRVPDSHWQACSPSWKSQAVSRPSSSRLRLLAL